MNVARVHARLCGERLTFAAECGGMTLLEAAREAGIELPSLCEAGICSACRARLVRGRVTMRNDGALDDDERAAGYVLACQAIAQSEALELDFDD